MFRFSSFLLFIIFFINLSFGSFFLDRNFSIVDLYNSSNKKIYIIADAHCDEITQKNIYLIVNKLLKKNNAFLAVEGNFGLIRRNFLNNIKSSKLKVKILDELISKGYISGWEKYFYLNNNDIFGLESEDIYLQNFKALYQSIFYYDFYESFYKKVSETIDSIKKLYIQKSLEIMKTLKRNIKKAKLQKKHG